MHNLLTPERRKRFEELTLDVVKADLADGGIRYIGGGDARRAAMLWIKEEEEKNSQVEESRHKENVQVASQGVTLAKWALGIAAISLVISVIALFK